MGFIKRGTDFSPEDILWEKINETTPFVRTYVRLIDNTLPVELGGAAKHPTHILHVIGAMGGALNVAAAGRWEIDPAVVIAGSISFGSVFPTNLALKTNSQPTFRQDVLGGTIIGRNTANPDMRGTNILYGFKREFLKFTETFTETKSAPFFDTIVVVGAAPNGQITSATLQDGGNNLPAGTLIVVSPPTNPIIGSGGVQAVFGTDIVDGVMDSFTIDNGGLGYEASANPTATIVQRDVTYYYMLSNANARQFKIKTSDIARQLEFVIKDIAGAGSGTITVSCENGELIDGSATFLLAADFGSQKFKCDGTKVFLVD